VDDDHFAKISSTDCAASAGAWANGTAESETAMARPKSSLRIMRASYNSISHNARVQLILAALLIAGGQNITQIMEQAADDFRAGRFAVAVRGFDRAALLAPAEAPFMWQRGIAQYYAGQFSECAKMFASHRTVNPDDVENAAWHFLCVAKSQSPEAARRLLLPVGSDSRVPMRQIYQLFQGRMTTAEVLNAAGNSASAQFFAHLYCGLYLDASGDRDAARAHIEIAAQPRYAAAGGYMHDVARVHLLTSEK
jgi:lipoprotein NlpI